MLGLTSRLRDLFRFIFLTADYEPFEFLASFVLLISGLVVLNPYTDIYTTSHSYDYVKLITTEPVLGTLLLFVSFNKFFALLHGSLTYRMYITIAASFTWAFLFVIFLSADLGVWFPWIFGLFCLVSAATAARMHRDVCANVPPWTHK
jgi:hypothetical protein